jgi:hypothetical protein
VEKRTRTGAVGDGAARTTGVAFLVAHYGFLLAGLALLAYEGLRALSRQETLSALGVGAAVALAFYTLLAVAPPVWRTFFPPRSPQDEANVELRAELERLTRRSGASH